MSNADRTSRPGPRHHLYFARETFSGAIKIGISRAPEARIASLAHEAPFALEILSTRLGTHLEERALHHAFADAQIKGEWFWPVPDLVAIAHGDTLLLHKALAPYLSEDAPKLPQLPRYRATPSPHDPRLHGRQDPAQTGRTRNT